MFSNVTLIPGIPRVRSLFIIVFVLQEDNSFTSLLSSRTWPAATQ